MKTSGLGDRLYVGGNDISGDIGSLSSISGSRAALDFTAITQEAFERKHGLRDGSIEFTSYFNPDGAHPTLSAMPTSDIIVSYFRGTTVGNPAASLVAKQVGYDPTRGNDGALTLNTSAQANGYGLEWGVMLTPSTDTATAAGSGSSLDLSGIGEAFVVLSGASGDYVSTPDAAALDITGDIDIRCKVALDDWTPAAQNTLVAKWNSSTDQRSFQLGVTTGGNLTLGWSEDGTTASALSEQSSVATGFTDGTAHWVRAVLDADDGSGDASVTFYTSEDGVTWTQLGATQAVGSTTSIFAGTAVLELGAQNAGTANRVAGRIYEAEVYDGTTLVTHPVAGVGGFTDSEGLTWTVQGNAYLSTGLDHGGQMYLHVLDFDGTDITFGVETSYDDGSTDTYAGLTGGLEQQVTSAPGAFRTATTAHVKRYVRPYWYTTGGFTSVTFALMFKANTTEVSF